MSIGEGLREENRLRRLLGQGEPGLHTLLGGEGSAPSAFGPGATAGGAAHAVRVGGEIRLAGGGASTGGGGGGRGIAPRDPLDPGGNPRNPYA